MKKLSGAEIRESFLHYFEERGHRRVGSSPLVPLNDPTLLFTNAGMVQFKDVFTGREKRDYTRATTAQKCVRAGGKHNDLENVGFTARHHTFFEMLGNFSFGDYFKKEAITYAWELVTKVLGIPTERLAVTVFKGEDGIPADDEAASMWQNLAKVPKERIYRLGKKDNFWAMGDTGPCGPCSEIHFHQGDDLPCALEASGKKCEGVACDCDRWLEIWNLVFMQFERGADGKLTSLPKPSIDTGAGLERLAAVVQGKRSNYDTDLFQQVIGKTAQLAGKRYGQREEDDVSLRVIADHSRATAFLIADGVLPSNEGRGYVLRRIMRRAIRHGTKIGLSKPFLHETAKAIIEAMSSAYPELRENQALVLEVSLREEEAFRRTLDKGLKILEEEIAHLREKKAKVIPGTVVFQLYDTFGFPEDLTRIVAAEKGFEVDAAGFEAEMARQRASSEWKGSDQAAVEEIYHRLASKLGETRFLGYETLSSEATIKALLRGGKEVESASAGESVEIICEQTPFYAESGGQVGDTGLVEWASGSAAVEDSQKPAGGLVAHRAKIQKGALRLGEKVKLSVDAERRQAIRLNHSATHLLHLVLRKVAGEHVKQSGSKVGPDGFRFDYTHFSPLTPEQIQQVEDQVNDLVRRNFARETKVVSVDEARAHGATMLFGEKYGDKVRMVQIGPSLELCGGTHVDRTGDIGAFLIVSDESLASGIRRIAAITGREAIRRAQEQRARVRALADALRVPPDRAAEQVQKLLSQVKALEKEIDQARKQGSAASSADLLSQVREVKGVKVLAARVQPADPKAYRDLADKLRDKLGSGVVFLAGEKDGKAVLLVATTPDLVGKGYRAGDLIKELAKEVGGSGGGKPDIAQAGGTDVGKIDRALERVYELI